MVTTTVSLIITNENVPEDPSLPDLLLDQVTYWPAGVVVSETLMALAMITAFVTVMMHKHRSIILRRVFFIVGLMYFYRAITMSITVLPKPDQHWECPKQNTTSPFKVIIDTRLTIISNIFVFQRFGQS